MSLTVPLFLLIMALVMLLWLSVSEDALRIINERAGTPYRGGSVRWSKRIIWGVIVFALAALVAPKKWSEPPRPLVATYLADSLWAGMDTTLIEQLDGDREDLVAYGRELIRNTASYLGPHGSVAQQTNGMNCQNCHLEAGTKPWGNNYGAVWSTYPKFRERSGSTETVAKRINDCFERSLNGKALDTNSHEMKALVAYMEWLGTGIARKQKPKGTGIVDLPFMDRAADPVNGEKLFHAKCALCHQKDGSGLLAEDKRTYRYPPLWGPHSYNIGAGLYRLSRFAGYVKNNMPQGVTWEAPQLSDEEAWDVAAFVDSRQRPDRDLSKDWPKISGKPVDHPFGPYADAFNEEQHKFGPFGPIAEARKSSAAAAAPTTPMK